MFMPGEPSRLVEEIVEARLSIVAQDIPSIIHQLRNQMLSTEMFLDPEFWFLPVPSPRSPGVSEAHAAQDQQFGLGKFRWKFSTFSMLIWNQADGDKLIV